MSECVCCRQLAKLTPGYVGADLMALTRKASMIAVKRFVVVCFKNNYEFIC